MVSGFHTLEDNVVLGAPPSGYVTKNQHAHMPVVYYIPTQNWVNNPFVSQAKQLHTVADHLHKRINAQDKMIQQLHNDIDAMSRDKKRAIAKYQKVQKELDDLTVTQPAVSQELPDYSSTSTRPQRHYAMHVSVGLAALCTWWYYLQDVPALERKLLSVLLSPVCYFYVSSILTQWRQWSSIFMYCAAWFLIGFVNCRRLAFSHTRNI
ncbi:MAG: hypothetical protein FRX49_03237 [Trebouxia sp. A1-2]|nr:MAG: hypothetical protein FRX49_03237 [Trebouxia sp. A1-2]